MVRVAKGIVCTISILVCLWAFVSWVDVITDNHKPNPQHSDYNMFVLMTADAKQEEEVTSTCGSPLLGMNNIRLGLFMR